uniref:Uncharacterized protein n=1 Tax=Myotis myotis TaxID=51298 RepID=A0A7J7QTP8_MYOMY|nr:hypothetical protein mMyoMyo1_011825 [Myotis myotis]
MCAGGQGVEQTFVGDLLLSLLLQSWNKRSYMSQPCLCFIGSRSDQQPGPIACPVSLSVILFLIYFIDFLQRGRERDRELETSMREKHRSAASFTLPTWDEPATKVHALDQNRTWDPLVRRPMLCPLKQTG